MHALDLTGRRVLVLGGGPAAELRVRALLADGALVRVVAPHVCEGLRDLAAHDERVTVVRRDVVRDHLADVWLVSPQDVDAARDEQVRAWC